ncbi:MAG TPA: hypothetical protein VIL85_23665 [Thermomicrobiales bacterium]
MTKARRDGVTRSRGIASLDLMIPVLDHVLDFRHASAIVRILRDMGFAPRAAYRERSARTAPQHAHQVQGLAVGE